MAERQINRGGAEIRGVQLRKLAAVSVAGDRLEFMSQLIPRDCDLVVLPNTEIQRFLTTEAQRHREDLSTFSDELCVLRASAVDLYSFAIFGDGENQTA
jgi:hypothetical protein